MVLGLDRQDSYLGSCLRKHLVLLQHALPTRFVGDLEERDAFDGGHGLSLSSSLFVICLGLVGGGGAEGAMSVSVLVGMSECLYMDDLV